MSKPIFRDDHPFDATKLSLEVKSSDLGSSHAAWDK